MDNLIHGFVFHDNGKYTAVAPGYAMLIEGDTEQEAVQEFDRLVNIYAALYKSQEVPEDLRCSEETYRMLTASFVGQDPTTQFAVLIDENHPAVKFFSRTA